MVLFDMFCCACGGLWLGENARDDGFVSDFIVTEEFQEASGRAFLTNAEDAALRERNDLFEQEFLAREIGFASKDNFIVMLQKRVHVHFQNILFVRRNETGVAESEDAIIAIFLDSE